MDEKTALTYAIVRALAYQENGGKPNLYNLKAGGSGELKSVFQYLPESWKHDAKTYLGDENAQLTPDNETQVMTKKVGKLIDEGYNVKQIASMHNAGASEPDAYTGKFSTGKASTGVNSHGVKYNVKQYADNVADNAIKFFKDDLRPQSQPVHQLPQSTVPTQAPPPQQPQGGLMGSLIMPKLGAPASF